MASEATNYTRTQDFKDGDRVVETVTQANQSSPKAEYDAIAAVLNSTGGNAIPAIYGSEDLLLRGGLDFAGMFGITNLQSINGGIFSVRGFGAVGDGSTDDRAAFIAAINAAIAAGGGVVFVEAVSNPSTEYYLFGDEIDFANDLTGTAANIAIVGTGRSSRIQIESGDTSDLFDLGGAENIQFHNLALLSDSGQTGGFLINNAGPYFHLSRCWLSSGSSSMSGALAFSAASSNLYPTIRSSLITGAYTSNVVTLLRTTGAYLGDGLILELTSGTPNDGLFLANNASGDNEDCTINGIRIFRSAGDADGTCLRFGIPGAIHTGRVFVDNYTFINSVAPSVDTGVVEMEDAENVSLGRGHIFANNDDANLFGVNMDGSTHCEINGARVVGNGGSGAGTGINVAGASFPLIVGCKVYNFGAGTGIAGASSATSGEEGAAWSCYVTDNNANISVTNLAISVTDSGTDTSPTNYVV